MRAHLVIMQSSLARSLAGLRLPRVGQAADNSTFWRHNNGAGLNAHVHTQAIWKICLHGRNQRPAERRPSSAACSANVNEPRAKLERRALISYLAKTGLAGLADWQILISFRGHRPASAECLGGAHVQDGQSHRVGIECYNLVER